MIQPTPNYSDFNIKAHCPDPDAAEKILVEHQAEYIGEDFQTDTYYEVSIGKLKLREGNIERLLTHYYREELDNTNKTTVFFYIKNPDSTAMGIVAGKKQIGQITKRRKIYFIDNVKFHLDTFDNGESFIEIETIDKEGLLGMEKIKDQCDFYKNVLHIRNEEILKKSYIDWMK